MPNIAESAHLRMNFQVPSIMCDGCTPTVKKAFEEVAGIDSVTVDHETKTTNCLYNLASVEEPTRQEILKLKQVTVEVVQKYLQGVLNAINKNLENTKPRPHEPATLQTVELVRNADANTITKDVKAPSLGEMLMKHPAMKGLQATTMVLMIPMIPIMISAIYVEASRPFTAHSSMGEM